MIIDHEHVDYHHLQLLQGTPSSSGEKRRKEDVGDSHEAVSHSHSPFSSHPQAGSHRGARTDSDLESPDAGDTTWLDNKLALLIDGKKTSIWSW